MASLSLISSREWTNKCCFMIPIFAPTSPGLERALSGKLGSSGYKTRDIRKLKVVAVVSLIISSLLLDSPLSSSSTSSLLSVAFSLPFPFIYLLYYLTSFPVVDLDSPD